MKVNYKQRQRRLGLFSKLCLRQQLRGRIQGGAPADLTGGAVNVGCGWTASAWNLQSQERENGFTRRWLRFDQTITDLTSGNLGIPLVVI